VIVQTARFWTHHKGSLVRISLRDGERLSHSDFEWTDEGTRTTNVRYSRYGCWVEFHTYNRERDCDGVVESDETLVCHVLDLTKGPIDENWFMFPAWSPMGDSVYRDHSAEAAGY